MTSREIRSLRCKVSFCLCGVCSVWNHRNSLLVYQQIVRPKKRVRCRHQHLHRPGAEATLVPHHRPIRLMENRNRAQHRIRVPVHPGHPTDPRAVRPVGSVEVSYGSVPRESELPVMDLHLPTVPTDARDGHVKLLVAMEKTQYTYPELTHAKFMRPSFVMYDDFQRVIIETSSNWYSILKRPTFQQMGKLMQTAAKQLNREGFTRISDALMSEVAILHQMTRNFAEGFQPTGDPKVDGPAFNALIDEFNAERFELWDTLRRPKTKKWGDRHIHSEYPSCICFRSRVHCRDEF